MGRKRYYPKPTKSDGAIPFADGTEAWFWYIRCQKLRLMGAKFREGESQYVRPCEPDDLYRAAMSLKWAGRLDDEHLFILGTFGLREAPPDDRVPEEIRPAKVWGEAINRLENYLKDKGIVT